MNILLKLSLSFLREHPLRVCLTSIATIASTCMVIWVVSGYDALLKTFDEYANVALGRYVLSIAPISRDLEKPVDPTILPQLQADPNVAAVDSMWAQRAVVKSDHSPLPDVGRKSDRSNPARTSSTMNMGGGPPSSSAYPETVVMACHSKAAPFDMVQGRWLDLQQPELFETVIRSDTAERLKVQLDDEITVLRGSQESKLKVVGVLKVPVMVGAGRQATALLRTPSTGEVFITHELAELIFQTPRRITFVGISLKNDAEITKFRFGWAPKLSQYEVPLQFQEAHEIEEALDQAASAQNVQLQAYAATGISMLVALLVIFCTLNMGVSERVRQLAILRAIVLTRTHVAVLIAIEGMLLATIGFSGGLFFGQIILMCVAKSSAQLLHHGAVIGSYSVGLAFLSAYGGALLASIFPAYASTRVRPIDAMSPQSQSMNIYRVRLPWGVLGIALLAVNPVLTFVIKPTSDTSVVLHMAIGFTCMAAGFVILAPYVVMLTDIFITPVLATLLAIDPKLLKSQITSHIWRTVGAAISLAIGLGFYIAIQVWGFTMMEAFIPGAWAPDATLSFQPHGIPLEQALAVSKIKGIDPRRFAPIVSEQPRLLEDLTHSAERASVTRQDNVVIVGIDPERGFGGPHPLFQFEWVDGTPQTAIEEMSKGHGCIVPDHFLEETNLKLGDSFSMVPPENPEHPVSYKIVGAIKLPGWHWQTKQSGLRPRTRRAAALIFADYPSVAKDFNLPNATHVWFSYADPQQVDTKWMTDEAQKIWTSTFAARNIILLTSTSPDQSKPQVRLMPVESIRETIRGSAKRWIWLIGQIPLIALAISCFGVLNVMIASVRARRWEIGVLRSIGFTSGTIVRTIIAEGILIGIVAGILSLSFGIMSGWCGCGLSQYVSFFGGLDPILVVPWVSIFSGFISLILLMILTAIWPAISIGRSRPLTLLQKGRSSF
jgi:putative ABC transport system permease protein